MSIQSKRTALLTCVQSKYTRNCIGLHQIPKRMTVINKCNKIRMLKFRPYGAIQIFFIIFSLYWAHQRKAAGRKIRLDIQNYGYNGNLLCGNGVVERNRISYFAEPLKKRLAKNTVNTKSLLGRFCWVTLHDKQTARKNDKHTAVILTLNLNCLDYKISLECFKDGV